MFNILIIIILNCLPKSSKIHGSPLKKNSKKIVKCTKKIENRKNKFITISFSLFSKCHNILQHQDVQQNYVLDLYFLQQFV